MAHPNEELVRKGYDAFNRGDVDTLRELFDPEIVWHFPGRSPLAGDHRGPDAVVGVLRLDDGAHPAADQTRGRRGQFP